LFPRDFTSFSLDFTLQADLNGFPIVTTGETADFVLGGITEVNKVSDLVD
jgi:hypothetical protein